MKTFCSYSLSNEFVISFHLLIDYLIIQVEWGNRMNKRTIILLTLKYACYHNNLLQLIEQMALLERFFCNLIGINHCDCHCFFHPE